MNIIDRNIKTGLILLLTAVLLSTSCRREDPVEEPECSGLPISLAADTRWPDLTKGTDDLIESNEALADDGFVVWAELESIPVFGEAGTKVYHDNPSDPADPLWNYTPERYWQIGTYEFAAVLPASSFAPENYKEDDTEHGSFTGEYDGSGLTISFGEHGFNLSENQTDLMVAFQTTEIDEATYSEMMNGTVEPEDVNLNFSHQLALLNFSIKNIISIEPTTDYVINPSMVIESVTVGGMHDVATGAVFSSEGAAVWTYGTTADNYITVVPEEATLAYDGVSNVIENLIVFPETGCNLTVTVTYKETYNNSETVSITKSATIPDCSWEAGKRYTYPLHVSETEIIFFGEPTVTEWVVVEEPVGGIVIK